MRKKKRNHINYLLDEPLIYDKPNFANGGKIDSSNGNYNSRNTTLTNNINNQVLLKEPGYLQNESGEEFIQNELGNFNVSNYDANRKLTNQEYQDYLKFIEKHGMGVDEFYKTYPDQDTYNKEFPKFDAQQYALGGRLMYHNGRRKYGTGGSTWGMGELNQGELIGNSNLTNPQASAIGSIGQMGGDLTANIIDAAVPDQNKRVDIGKQTAMGTAKGAGMGTMIGANPLLVGLTGGLSIPIGAALGAGTGALVSNVNAHKDAKANHDALMQENYGITNSYDMGGSIGNIHNQFGNQLSEFKGPTHNEGGIQLTNNAEVEGGEAKWKDYIFSDQLIGDKNQMTFAQRAKKINAKYKGRENDKLANNALEIELKKLAQENDYVKQQHEQNTMNSHLNDLKQYGDHVDIGDDGTPQYSDGGRLELIKGARSRGLSVDEFARHLVNSKVKYGYGGGLGKDGKSLNVKTYYEKDGTPYQMYNNTFSSPTQLFQPTTDERLLAGEKQYDNYNNSNPDNYSPNSNFMNPFGMMSSSQSPYVEQFPNPSIDVARDGITPKSIDANPNYYSSVDGPRSELLPEETYNQSQAGLFAKTYGINNFGSNIPKVNTPSPFDINNEPQMDYGFTPTNYNTPTSKNDLQMNQAPVGFDKFLDEHTVTSRNTNKAGYQEAGLLASNIPAVDNWIKSLSPSKTNFDRVSLDRMNLQQARDLNARNSALGQRITQANVRNNATSSGSALSNLSASNAALTSSRINADMQTYLQENQANTQIGNQEKMMNNQISNNEIDYNQKNKANAQSVGNASLASIANNSQGYLFDKQSTQANKLENDRLMQVVNQMQSNYKWGVDPETDKMMIQFVSKLGK